MSPQSKKKIFGILLFLILAGIIIYFVTNNNSSFIKSVFGYGENQPLTAFIFTDPGATSSTVVYAYGYTTAIVTPIKYGDIKYPNTLYKTSYNQITNPDTIYTGTSVQAFPLDLSAKTSTNSPFKPDLTMTTVVNESELGIFQAIMLHNTSISNFMSNDTQWIPYKVTPSTTGGTPTIAVLNANSFSTPLYSYVSYTTASPPLSTINKISVMISTSTASINQALYVPAGTSANVTDPTKSTDSTTTPSNFGTAQPGQSMSSAQRYRLQLILGVLVANHMFLNDSPVAESSTFSGNITSFFKTKPNSISYGTSTAYNGLLADLFTNYMPDKSTTTTAPASWRSGITWIGGDKGGSTYNSIHAVILYLMARDAWLSSMITNILLL